MRPRRLEMDGFLAYREPAEIDFTDADLFVLSGATGSGKSSVIDAMIFALYGTIPRLDDRRSVAPVITAVSDRARVSFEFSIGDDIYTAARLVERRGKGATTTEARLQKGKEPLASGADEVTGAITDLLGLSFEHFTKAVVLPQGAFADFLTDKPKDRQALLRALLDLGLYEQIKVIANERAATARGRIESIEESLGNLDVPGEDEVRSRKVELKHLEAAHKELPDRLLTIRTLTESVEESSNQAVAGRQRIVILESSGPPRDLISLEERRSTAATAVEVQAKSFQKHRSALGALKKRLAAYPPASDLANWASGHDRLRRSTRAKAELGLAALQTEMAEAEARLAASRGALDALMISHSAHALREGLAAGEVCPVCLQMVADLPAPDDEASGSLEQAKQARKSLEPEVRALRDRLSEAQGEAKQLDLSIKEATAQLANTPGEEAAQQDLAAVKELMAEIERTELEAEDLSEGHVAAREAFELILEEASGLRDALLATRDGVAIEKPPSPGDDVVESWRLFDRWRLEQIRALAAETRESERLVKDNQKALESARSELTDWLEGIGLAVTKSPETDLALAIERLRTDIEAMSSVTEEAAEVEAVLVEKRAAAQVASGLGMHLRSNNFEAWVMTEALEVLVEGANRLLDDLSAGAYSLRVTGGQFGVIDHRNADLARSTKSLSGGEVFLVSLSLALSMAGQLAELTGSTSRLESIFLDEGFGSLDQESLDIVTAVLDDLVGQGRTVGIVTHVKDLSERIAIRYEVTKGPNTATIDKVTA